MKSIFASLVLFLASIPLFSQASIPGFHAKTLSNGLEVFVFENSTVPLTQIQIVFRCGAMTQTPKTAGLFHLFEHMLFKGNDVFPNEAAFNSAMTELGVSGWNGGTSDEYVKYYFTIPSDKTKKGIEFWSHAVQNPKLDARDLASEKQVVLNEVRGYYSDPGHILAQAMAKKAFSAYPWRLDAGGDETVVQNCTVDTLKEIQSTYYIPNNAALFVGGDVHADEVFAWAEASFGTWKRGNDPWKTPLAPHPFPEKSTYLIQQHPSQYPGIALVWLKLRGPDVLADPASTYAADVWLSLLDKPGGRFKSSIKKAVPELYDEDHLNVGYLTQRDAGSIDVTAYLVVKPGTSILDVAPKFEKALRDEMKTMAEDPKYFSDEEFQVVKRRILDQNLLEQETAEGFLNTLSFWWSSANLDYFLSYTDRFSQVTRKDVKTFLERFFTKPGVLALRVHPNDYTPIQRDLSVRGWETVTKENAFWWRASR